MTSREYAEAYVWIWLPGALEPVVAGRLAEVGRSLVFNYGVGYLKRDDAIAIYEPELPLRKGALPLPPGLSMPSSIRDGAPDAWGRRVLINRKFGLKGEGAAHVELDELTYLLESGSDRIGALDFQASPTQYVPRQGESAPLEALLTASEAVERGVPLAPDLALALQHGTSLGGARPKAQIVDGGRKFIAKFSSSSDLYNVVKAEYLAMRLAAEVGIRAADVRLVRALGKDVLLVERFDREKVQGGWRRKAMVSALTLFGLDEMMARYASYETLAEIIRHRFTNSAATLEELFRRLVFNILCGNTDDHARNHAAFWDGRRLGLTPAYDVCPQGRSGQEASQAMLITADQRLSRLANCLAAAPHFLLGAEKARAVIAHQVRTIQARWEAVCDEAALSVVDRDFLWRRQFLNPYAFQGAEWGDLGF
ncbi:MAG TPA: HipA domain-containing protein [Humidesulfovibrio sp.]|uniref:type II toxin-antitoxin system HipA family toxin n=1 Tax=Humidesulfovibrio sp. TaxID=2910988 RepID=UPI002BDF8384|nr:HipA domain-containing protein [Humidesulfovibrio sp.]HWR03064.1 HipA domain-containing protein [Humidesulfovibrio sp.]